MAVPPFHAFLPPLLEVLSDGQEHRAADVYDAVARHLLPVPDDRSELLPSGKRRLPRRLGQD